MSWVFPMTLKSRPCAELGVPVLGLVVSKAVLPSISPVFTSLPNPSISNPIRFPLAPPPALYSSSQGLLKV